MQLQLATWPDVEAYLATKRTIIVPIGSTEQHGPIGLIGTDALTADMVARDAGDASGTLVAPPINFGMAQHHLGFPGSIALRPTTLINLVADVVDSLALHGFNRFFFVNGHGGNIATLQAAFDQIYSERSIDGREPRVLCGAHSWFLSKEWDAATRERFNGRNGWHGTACEISMTMQAFPGAVKIRELTPSVPHGAEHFGDAKHFRELHPDGRMGSDSSLASETHGRELLRLAIDQTAAALDEFEALTARDLAR
jgi:creatinine amidohydrolase